jgi:DNA polymerase-1
VINAREIVTSDFEFEARRGERQVPVCAVAHELRSGRRFRIWQSEFGSSPPWATGPDVLYVAYFASAELGCYRALGWPMPERILDLYTEFRARTNGLYLEEGSGLLGALTYFGFAHMAPAEKSELRQAIGNGTWRGRYTPTEILDYCESDVNALDQLLPIMAPRIDLPRALLRGRYMAAVALMQWAGVPIDVEMLALLQENWDLLKERMIAEVDRNYGVFEGTTFKRRLFEALLIRLGIPWPRTPTGQLATDDDTFRQMAKAHPAIRQLRELLHALSEMRLNDLMVGHDGRNRTLLSPFQSRTGRNQPSNTEYIFGPSVWLRGLIKPPPGYGLAYIDWSQQEFGIAAALSGDPMMMAAYRSGDPYLAFAKQAGAVPADATKKSHSAERELYKQCVLALQYGMGVEGLADRIGQPLIVARDLIRSHHEVYRVMWRHSDAMVDHAFMHGSVATVYGWPRHLGDDPNPRSVRNHPIQGNGAEMLRIACCLATERGVEVVAPVHDAMMICAPLDRLEADIATTRAAMAEASRAVLGGFELRTDCPDEYDENGKPVEFPHIVRYPRRYMDERGVDMWETVMRLLREIKRQVA